MNYSQHMQELISKGVDGFVVKDFISVLHGNGVFDVNDPVGKAPNLLAFWLKKIAEHRGDPRMISNLSPGLFEILSETCGLEESLSYKEERYSYFNLKERLLSTFIDSVSSESSYNSVFSSELLWQQYTVEDFDRIKNIQSSTNALAILVERDFFDLAKMLLDLDLVEWNTGAIGKIKNLNQLQFFLDNKGDLDKMVSSGGATVPVREFLDRYSHSNEVKEKIREITENEDPEFFKKLDIRRYFSSFGIKNGLTDVLNHLKSHKQYLSLVNTEDHNKNALMYAAEKKPEVVLKIATMSEKNTQFLFKHTDDRGFDVVDYILKNDSIETRTVSIVNTLKTAIERSESKASYSKRGLMWKGFQLKLESQMSKREDTCWMHPSFFISADGVKKVVEDRILEKTDLWSGSIEDWTAVRLLLKNLVNYPCSEISTSKNTIVLSSAMEELLKSIQEYPPSNEVPLDVREGFFWQAMLANRPAAAQALLPGLSEIRSIPSHAKSIENSDLYSDSIHEIIRQLNLSNELKESLISARSAPSIKLDGSRF